MSSNRRYNIISDQFQYHLTDEQAFIWRIVRASLYRLKPTLSVQKNSSFPHQELFVTFSAPLSMTEKARFTVEQPFGLAEYAEAFSDSLAVSSAFDLSGPNLAPLLAARILGCPVTKELEEVLSDTYILQSTSCGITYYIGEDPESMRWRERQAIPVGLNGEQADIQKVYERMRQDRNFPWGKLLAPVLQQMTPEQQSKWEQYQTFIQRSSPAPLPVWPQDGSLQPVQPRTCSLRSEAGGVFLYLKQGFLARRFPFYTWEDLPEMPPPDGLLASFVDQCMDRPSYAESGPRFLADGDTYQFDCETGKELFPPTKYGICEQSWYRVSVALTEAQRKQKAYLTPREGGTVSVYIQSSDGAAPSRLMSMTYTEQDRYMPESGTRQNKRPKHWLELYLLCYSLREMTWENRFRGILELKLTMSGFTIADGPQQPLSQQDCLNALYTRCQAVEDEKFQRAAQYNGLYSQAQIQMLIEMRNRLFAVHDADRTGGLAARVYQRQVYSFTIEALRNQFDELVRMGQEGGPGVPIEDIRKDTGPHTYTIASTVPKDFPLGYIQARPVQWDDLDGLLASARSKAKRFLLESLCEDLNETKDPWEVLEKLVPLPEEAITVYAKSPAGHAFFDSLDAAQAEFALYMEHLPEEIKQKLELIFCEGG